MHRRCDPAPPSFSFLSFHLCLGDAADASRRCSYMDYFIKLCSLYGEGDRDLEAATSLYPFCNKRPEPWPEEPPERFANILCTQNDPLLLLSWKGLRGASPLLPSPKLSWKNLSNLGTGGHTVKWPESRLTEGRRGEPPGAQLHLPGVRAWWEEPSTVPAHSTPTTQIQVLGGELLSGPQILRPILDCLWRQFWWGTGTVSAPPEGACTRFHTPVCAVGHSRQACPLGVKEMLLSEHQSTFKKFSSFPPTPHPHARFLSFFSPFYPQSPPRKPLLTRAGKFPVISRDTLLPALVGWSSLFATEVHPGKCGLRYHQGRA